MEKRKTQNSQDNFEREGMVGLTLFDIANFYRALEIKIIY